MQFESTLLYRYKLRKLNLRDESILENLCTCCTDYYRITEGKAPDINSASKIIEEIPQGKKYKDKYVIGIFDSHNQLIGVLDMIKDYPLKYEWIISLLMIDPSKRHIGIGKSIHKYIKTQLQKTNAAQIRICVTEDNKSAYKFWKSLGYTEELRKKYQLGNKYSVFIVMTLTLISKNN